MNLLWKLLKKNISTTQLASFAIANFIGVSILLFSLILYIDILPLFTSSDNILDNNNYIIISKNIGTAQSFIGSKSTFSTKEIEDIKNQNFTQDIGIFTPSKYEVNASIKVNELGHKLSTAMFFESIPDEFVDTKDPRWTFDQNTNIIPIILPRDYLDLYNFGFAEAQQLPKISESLVDMMTLNITLYGQYQQEEFIGKVIGFSNRINTILVPEAFMEWANNKFSNTNNIEPARIIIKVNNIADENIIKYTEEKGYNINNNSANTSKASFILKIIISIIAVIGLIISLLSLYILTLSIHLLIQKNKEKILNLNLIGYSIKEIARPYIILSSTINAITIFTALIITLISRTLYIEYLKNILKETSQQIWITIPISIIVLLLIISFNTLIINKKIKSTKN